LSKVISPGAEAWMRVTLGRIRPRVVAADEVARRSLRIGEDSCPAVPADVVEDVDAAVVVVQDDEGVRTVVERDIITRLGDLGNAAREDPVLTEDALHVEVEEVVIGVERCLEREADPTGVESDADLVELLFAEARREALLRPVPDW
jgi:hypothetical protein